MELQTFIDDNNDYVDKFKENNLYIRKYSLLKLILVKAKRGVNYDYENNVWMRYCRGAIINTETNRVVCIPPVKSFRKEDINIDEYDETYSFEPLVDGVMINMFYHNGEWVISTRSNIGAKNKWDGKTPFHELFKKVNGTKWFDLLDKNNCYSFTLQHRDNRIITPVYKNLIFMNEIYNLSDGQFTKLRREEYPTIEGIDNIQLLERKDIDLYLQYDNIFSVKGFTIKKDSLRIKWINPNYEYVERLKINNNNKFFTYMELRRSYKLTEYLKFFPEEQYLFDNYRNKYNLIKDELYNSYVSLKIKKEKEWSDIRYEFKPLVNELHSEYKGGKGKINAQYVSSYMERLPIGKLFFIYNRIF
tara:strand:+ start:3652 stop:4731 length:1080 start_codon:yes stop_codon:yes gene_type:complete